MSRVGRARERRNAESGISNPESWFTRLMNGGSDTHSGASVSTESAMRHADVWACVRTITDEVSSCPLIHYERSADFSRKRFAPRLGDPMAVLSNPAPGLLTSPAFWGLVAAHLNTGGNSFSWKFPGKHGEITRLWPIKPSRVTVGLTNRANLMEPIYLVQPGEDGTPGGEFTARQILHFKGLSMNGVTGLSPIGQAREAIGLGISQEEYAAQVFRNGAAPRGILYRAKAESLNDDAKRQLKDQWNSLFGRDNAGGMAILDKDKDEFKAVSLSPADLAFIEQRRLSTAQIARIFRVPPWAIGASSGDPLTYKTVEGQLIMLAQSAIRPWFVNIEGTINADPDFYPSDGSFFGEFLMDAMLRADSSARAQNNSLAINKWKTANEIRREEGDPDIEGGDVFAKPTPPPAPSAPAVEPDDGVDS